MALTITDTQVYVAATAIHTAYGTSVIDTYQKMKTGVSALSPDTYGTNNFYSQRIVDDTEPFSTLSRIENIALQTAKRALKSVPTLNPIDIQLIVCTTKGNIGLAKSTSTITPNSELLLYNSAQKISSLLGTTAYRPIVVSNACISGVVGPLVGSRLIRAGKCRHALIVALDEMTDFITSGFISFRSVSSKPCLPYDKRRDGLSLGEAAGAMLLTTDYTLSVGACISGGAMSDDANHISGPSRTGLPLSEAINTAIAESKITTNDVAFVNTHGTATIYNDEMESKALNAAGLTNTPLNSLKPYFGHTLGASGLIELIICLCELQDQTLLGTLGFSECGTPYPVNMSVRNRPISGTCCLKTASGFGGCNVALVLTTDTAKRVATHSHTTYHTLHTLSIENGQIIADGQTILSSTPDFDTFIRNAYHTHCQPNMKFFKMDDISRLAYVGSEIILADLADEKRANMGILFTNTSSSLDTDLIYCSMQEKGEENPARFVYTLPNIMIGEVCIRHHIFGETLFVASDNNYDHMYLTNLATNILHSDTILCGRVEKLKDKYSLCLSLITKQD